MIKHMILENIPWTVKKIFTPIFFKLSANVNYMKLVYSVT